MLNIKKQKENVKKETFKYRAIYAFTCNYESHKGLIKVGETEFFSDKSIEELLINNNETLINAAIHRINKYTNTAGMEYTIEHVELALKKKNESYTTFRDYDVHKVLKRSGINVKKFSHSTAKEWFETDVISVKKAIKAVKENKSSIDGISGIEILERPIFRDEQEEYIVKAVLYFSNVLSDSFLCSAKMRYGKTLTTLEIFRRLNHKHVAIITHRPSVEIEWFEAFKSIFCDRNDVVFCSRNCGESLADVDRFLAEGKTVFEFHSIQDLRESEILGGRFDKNKGFFNSKLDGLIIDEAHEGTTTELGKTVITNLAKNGTKVLYLSGTSYNLEAQFSPENSYHWTYLQEQKMKEEWSILHPDEPNPYADMPKMNFFTIDLSAILGSSQYHDINTLAFSFREFFKTQTRINNNEESYYFEHQNDVYRFLDMISSESDYALFPYSNEAYVNLFKHTLWMLPGVKEGKALKELMSIHPFFSKFEILNICGNEESDDAINYVKNGIKEATRKRKNTIVLSCGKLTAGNTIPEWNAILYLTGSTNTSASSYLQAVFRVQSPGTIDGRIKENCYVFDFAPDRTLKMLHQHVSSKHKKESDIRVELGEFLNYAPVIAFDGSKMKRFDHNNMLQEIKKAYVDRVVQNGFEDDSLYKNNELINMTSEDLENLRDLARIVGNGSKSSTKNTELKEIPVNRQGFSNEEYEQITEIIRHGNNDTELTPEQQERLDALKELEDRKKNTIKILKEVSKRMPIMAFGYLQSIKDLEELSLENFIENIDENSIQDFMQAGLTKEKLKYIIKFYDEDVLLAAFKKVIELSKYADTLYPLEREKVITETIFGYFKNPDKETILTPNATVHRHLSNAIGGYTDYDEDFKKSLDKERYVSQKNITQCLFENNSKILEINSKSGLYPMYIVRTKYIKELEKLGVNEKDLSIEEAYNLWGKCLENVYVLCSTKMAQIITIRTLVGTRNIPTKVKYIENLSTDLQNGIYHDKEILSPTFWGEDLEKGESDMIIKFNAVIGNPAYQQKDGGAQASSKPLYNRFIELAKLLNPDYISMIVPSRWMTGGKGLDDFRQEMLHDKRMSIIHDYANNRECFPTVDIKGGVMYFLWDNSWNSTCDVYRHNIDEIHFSQRYLVEEGDNIFIREARLIPIKNKVSALNEPVVEKIVSPRKPYGLSGDIFANPSKYNLPEISNEEIEDGIKIIGLGNKNKRVIKYVPKDYPFPRTDMLNSYKIFITRNYGCGEIGEVPATPVLATPVLATPGMACTETFVQIGPFNTEEEARNFLSYLKTKFFRAMVGIRKQDQGASRAVYHYVPLQDFSKPWTDEELYSKYNLTEEEIAFIEKVITPME